MSPLVGLFETPSNCSSKMVLSSSGSILSGSLGIGCFCALTGCGLTGMGFDGGRLGLTERGGSEGGTRLDLGGDVVAFPPDVLSNIFRGSLLGFLRRCTKFSTS